MTFTLFTYLPTSNNSVCFGIDTKDKILSYDYFSQSEEFTLN